MNTFQRRWVRSNKRLGTLLKTGYVKINTHFVSPNLFGIGVVRQV